MGTYNLVLHMQGQMHGTSLLIGAFVVVFFSTLIQHSSTTKIRNYLIIFLLNSPVPLNFIGYHSQVSLDAAHLIMSCFNNMFFQSFHHHSRITQLYICLAYWFSIVYLFETVRSTYEY